MSEDRYQVLTLSGWSIPNGRYGHSYSVIDTAYCCREVFRAHVGDFGAARGDIWRKQHVHRECDRLNAIERSRYGTTDVAA